MCSQTNECAIEVISYEKIAIRIIKWMCCIFLFFLLSCKPFCSCTRNSSSQGHCISSQGSKYNQCVCNQCPSHMATANICSYYAYSMKSLNDFQNALPSDFELLRTKVLIYCNLSKLIKESRTSTLFHNMKKCLLSGKISPSWQNLGAVLNIA